MFGLVVEILFKMTIKPCHPNYFYPACFKGWINLIFFEKVSSEKDFRLAPFSDEPKVINLSVSAAPVFQCQCPVFQQCPHLFVSYLYSWATPEIFGALIEKTAGTLVQ